MFPGFAKQPFDAILGWHNDKINTIFQGKGELTHVAADGLRPDQSFASSQHRLQLATRREPEPTAAELPVIKIESNLPLISLHSPFSPLYPYPLKKGTMGR